MGITELKEKSLHFLQYEIKESTDPITQVICWAQVMGTWYYGVNKIDETLPFYHIKNRTELYYATIEHAEINLLKKLPSNPEEIYITLFPCPNCMKVLIDSGIKKIHYINDRPEREWSKKSHEMALNAGIKILPLSL